jgi:hypothetical protein
MREVDHDPAVAQIAQKGQTTDTGLIGAQLRAVRPIFGWIPRS